MSGLQKKLVVVGDFAWDVLIRTNQKLHAGGDTFGEVMLAPGGSAANVAVWASRCGMPTAFIGKIGRDRFGELAINDLLRENVQFDPIQTDEHRTASVAVWIDHIGQRSMVSGQGADFYLLPSELPIDIVKDARHLHLTAWSFFTDPPRSAARLAANIAKKNGVTLSLDPGSFQMIEEMGVDKFIQCTNDLGIDIFFPNFEEGKVLTGKSNEEEIAQTLAEIYPGAIIALKLDKDGAMININGKSTHIPPGTETIIDATGAGDAFAGAYLSQYLINENHLKAARFSVKISSWVVNKIGARPSMDRQLLQLVR
ncbi:MAG: sugar kinase [Candidatus Marinimicrobia bacterium]|nr:sugar kinase [Candidatus Neomarinimicrobiota bacterium]